MSELNQNQTSNEFSRNAVEAAIRISLIAMLVFWCFMIFKPFVIPVLWAIIIAVAIFPLYQKFEALFGEKKKIALIVFTLIALSLLIVPSIMLLSSMVETAQSLAEKMQQGGLQIPAPPEKVATWPLIGETLFKFWSNASQNLMATVSQFTPQLKTAGAWLLTTAAGAGGSVLQFIISIIIAAVFIANADNEKKFSQSLFVRLAGEAGKDFSELAGATMRSVAQGVLGVAFIQAVLAGIGLLVMDVPGAGLWAMLVLLLAVVQLPPILILGPIMIYVFSVADTLPAVLFLIYGFVVSASDAFLKPMFLGRGMEIPMLVILIGAIGGMMMSGIIGLFIGAVVLAIGYELFMAWLKQE